jgi:CRP-like cAMP-binding protein
LKSEITTAPDAVALGDLPFFKGLSFAQLQTLAECAMQTSFAAGAALFRERDPANRFYVMLSGSVALESRPNTGEPLRILTLGAGDVLGWSWLFPPYRWHFDARALEPVSAIFFYATRLCEHCETDPELGYALVMRMAEVMMQRLQATQRQLFQISDLAQRSQWEALQLAAQLGTSPRPVKRHFRPDHPMPPVKHQPLKKI